MSKAEQNKPRNPAYCYGCGETLMACDNDPNGEHNPTCARCRAEEEHDFDANPKAKFDRQGVQL